ncbi:SH3 domain-containing protein [Christiangramia portivictoriae]|uniref:SH3 domain-containing protein n=1 Tax=Christiangramia portivictoriae TaxID=326069 RepID=UPI000428C41E|nr:tetratricopeptide repeat protein [Christiangramia portivictoriae]
MRQVFVLIFLLVSLSGFSQNQELFEIANLAYQNGEFEAAISSYEKILKDGEASAELYYNLGNAHYKLNNVAPSIYYFEKALQLEPKDEDILNNIEFARNMAIDDIDEVEETGLSASFDRMIANYSASGWAVFAIAFSVIFVILFLLYYISRNSLKKRVFLGLASLSLLACIITVVFAFQQETFVENNRYAIIFEEVVEVRDEPNLRGEASYELHEGTKAKVLENFQEWSRIQLSNGAQGWVQTQNIRKL